MMRYADVPEQLNLASYFVDRNVDEGRGDHTALIQASADVDTPVTYWQLAREVNRVGNVLREMGVRRGDRVLLALNDGVEFVATWYAAQKIGAVTAEVYTYLRQKDYAYYLSYTDAAVVVADRTTLEPLREVAGGRKLLVAGLQHDDCEVNEWSYDAYVGAASDDLAPVATRRDDVAIWKFTTGSTGQSKACVHPAHSALLSFDWYAQGVLGMSEDDVVLPVPKLFFGYARDLTALYPFGVGAAGVVFSERTTADVVFDQIRRHRPTILVNVPTMMSAMVSHPDAADQDLSCLRMCTSAGEALPAGLHQAWLDTFGVEVCDGIGSSEAYHIYLSNRPGASRLGTLGQVVPGYEARVVDESGSPVADGEMGVLEVTGETVALEYYEAPEKSAHTFYGDTLRTEDLFVRDREGFFSYRGRADDLLKVGGVFVAPSEVEHRLIDHPAVVECVVSGQTEGGLVRPRAYVVLGAASSPSGELAEELRQFVRVELAPHKAPRDVVFVDTLPKTANGKLDRKAVRAWDTGGENGAVDEGAEVAR